MCARVYIYVYTYICMVSMDQVPARMSHHRTHVTSSHTCHIRYPLTSQRVNTDTQEMHVYIHTDTQQEMKVYMEQVHGRYTAGTRQRLHTDTQHISRYTRTHNMSAVTHAHTRHLCVYTYICMCIWSRYMSAVTKQSWCRGRWGRIHLQRRRRRNGGGGRIL